MATMAAIVWVQTIHVWLQAIVYTPYISKTGYLLPLTITLSYFSLYFLHYMMCTPYLMVNLLTVE